MDKQSEREGKGIRRRLFALVLKLGTILWTKKKLPTFRGSIQRDITVNTKSPELGACLEAVESRIKLANCAKLESE